VGDGLGRAVGVGVGDNPSLAVGVGVGDNLPLALPGSGVVSRLGSPMMATKVMVRAMWVMLALWQGMCGIRLSVL